jgi:ubiquitin-protein ligase
MHDDMYTWHGNLRGPEDSAWKGGVFHFTMSIPRNYPVSPPSINLCTPIPHPNVFGNTICVDFLQSNTVNGLYESGWVPAYTIEAMLL